MHQRRVPAKAIAAVLAGNFFEYFDFLLYTHLVVILTPLFFPPGPKAEYFLSVIAFSTGWVVKPLAALVLGYVADRASRKKMLVFSTFLMGVATLAVACMPTYNEIGVWASVSMLICRVMQGVASAGDFVGATVYVVENAPQARKNFYSCLIYVSSTAGGVCATVCASLCIKLLGENAGWRIPFYIGSSIILLGFALQRLIPENEPVVQKKSVLWHELWKRRWPALGGILINMCHPIILTLTYVYVPRLLRDQFGCSADEILLQSSIVMGFEIAVVAILGYFGDIFRVTTMAYWRSSVVALLALPCTILLVHGMQSRWMILCVQLLFISFSHAELPLIPITLKRFSGDLVYTSYGLVWSVGRSAMYGLAPLLLWLSDYYFSTWGIALLLGFMALSYAFGIYCLERPCPYADPSDASPSTPSPSTPSPSTRSPSPLSPDPSPSLNAVEALEPAAPSIGGGDGGLSGSMTGGAVDVADVAKPAKKVSSGGGGDGEGRVAS